MNGAVASPELRRPRAPPRRGVPLSTPRRGAPSDRPSRETGEDIARVGGSNSARARRRKAVVHSRVSKAPERARRRQL